MTFRVYKTCHLEGWVNFQTGLCSLSGGKLSLKRISTIYILFICRFIPSFVDPGGLLAFLSGHVRVFGHTLSPNFMQKRKRKKVLDKLNILMKLKPCSLFPYQLCKCHNFCRWTSLGNYNKVHPPPSISLHSDKDNSHRDHLQHWKNIKVLSERYYLASDRSYEKRFSQQESNLPHTCRTICY